MQCFRNAARHLATGGRFVIELTIPNLRSFPPGAAAIPFDVPNPRWTPPSTADYTVIR